MASTAVDWVVPDTNVAKEPYLHITEVALPSSPVRPADMPLLDQCPEVLHNIFIFVDPSDLANLSQTCRHLYRFISSDTQLWKIQYLSRYDPPTIYPLTPTEWKAKTGKLTLLSKLLLSRDADLKRERFSEAASTAIDLMTSTSIKSPWRNRDFLSTYFTNRTNIAAYLCRSSLFARCRMPDDTPLPTEEERQLSAKLHVYYGLEVEPTSAELETIGGVERVHPYARSRVYDLRRYNEHNMWGPFMNDGSQRIDWEKVQAIMIDLTYNLRIFTERTQGDFAPFWDQPFHGLSPNSFVSRDISETRTQHSDLDLQDPYGVAGTWMRIVCFLDYNDLYAFNFESDRIASTQERDPISTREAFRLIFLKLRVTQIDPPGEHDHPDWPVVSFTGTSKSIHMSWDPNANSKIRGTVRTTPHGDIRWTSFSIFNGEERWRSESVQIGGVKSQRGMLGTWFDKDYDAHGPAGPTAFWKLSDDIVEERRPAVPSGNFGYIIQQ